MMEDEEIRLALGLDAKGMCLRHPNVQVARTEQSTNEVDQKYLFQACKVCRSELAAGGLQLQRKSMAYSIQAVQELHQDKRRWDNFKQNWKNDNNEVGEHIDVASHIETDDTLPFKNEISEKHFKNKNVVTGDAKHSKNLNDIVRDALLRGSQVQRWLLVEKTKEIDNLKKELEILTMENEVLRKEMREQRESFEETIRRQEKTIHQELKMIKSIASQRAVSRTTKSSHSYESEPGIHQSHSSLVHSSTASLSLSNSSHGAQPPLPVRLASDKEGAATTTTCSSAEKCIGILSAPKVPPKLPTSPNSNHPQTMTKHSTKPKISPRSVQRKFSGLSSPSCAHTSDELALDTTLSQSNHLQNCDDTKPAGILNSLQSNPYESNNVPSNSVREERSADTARESQNNNESSGSQEISFVPTESERIVRTTSITEATGNLHKENNEIEFDATMRFDAKQQLLLEASQAISVGNIPTTSQRHRKMSSKDFTEGSSDTPQEIVFDNACINSLQRNRQGIVLPDSEKTKTVKQELQERIVGKVDVASAEDEEDDFGIPSELPVNSERYLECERETMNLSPVSALTSASYMFDAGFGTSVEDEVIEPKKALQNTPFAKRLPMEENFDSDDDTKPEERIVGTMKSKASASVFLKPTPRRATKKVLKVENQVVHDKYGDGGMYSGYISVKDRLPHGVGKMIYDNGREYEGDWKGGRWHGKIKMSPANNSSSCFSPLIS
jgi:hypothetical protein